MAASKHEDNMIKLQYQMRENHRDLEDFIKDMDSWEEDMKNRETQLTKEKNVKEPDLPPVRNSLNKKKKKKVKKSTVGEDKKQEKTSKKRISGYDYRSWDKLDVDKLCEDVDGTKSESSEYETDEEWELERRKQQALLEKDSGNEFFKRGDYNNAVESYSKGMNLDPTNPLLPANRAMALLKQEKYAAAEADCIMALTLDPLYVKAYLRLGSARFELKKFEKAKETFEKVLQLEPQNKKAKFEIERIEKELTKEKMVTHSHLTSPEVGIVKPISKPVERRSKKPLRRIEIEEVGIEEDVARKEAIAKVQDAQSQAKKELEARDGQMFEKFKSRKTEKIQVSFSSGDSKNSGGDKVLTTDTENVQSDVKSFMKPSDIYAKQDTEELKLNLMNGDTQKEESLSPRSENKSVSPRSFAVPTSSYQFQSDYKVLRNDLCAFNEYIQKIEPSNYPKLFGEALDAEILMKLLTVFQKFYIPENRSFYDNLCHLAEVKRFSMTVMFLSRKEQQVIKELFGHLKETVTVPAAELDKLGKKYELR